MSAWQGAGWQHADCVYCHSIGQRFSLVLYMHWSALQVEETKRTLKASILLTLPPISTTPPNFISFFNQHV